MTYELQESVDGACRRLLKLLGVDLTDPNCSDTPRRLASWLLEYAPMDEDEETKFIADTLSPVFPEAHSEMVIVRNISFSSLCMHHMLPFRGVAHVGYIPTDGVVGISKLARLVKGLARQPTLQERITRTVADAVFETLKCEGVMVVVTADHLCMQVRGVEDQYAQTVTSAVRGCFKTNDAGCKDEFLELIRK